LIAVLLSPTFCSAQDIRNPHAWFFYSGDHPVSTRWGLHFDTHVRSNDGLNSLFQTVVRPAVNFQAATNLFLQTGYASFTTFSPGYDSVHENRIYQQVSIIQPLRRVELQHRGRIEERWIEGQYENRYRYLTRGTIPVPNSGWYLAASLEILISQGHNGRHDRNRVYAGLGRNLSPDWGVEAGYFARWVRIGSHKDWIHTIQLGFFGSRPFHAK
jgi:hypothetical protein